MPRRLGGPAHPAAGASAPRTAILLIALVAIGGPAAAPRPLAAQDTIRAAPPAIPLHVAALQGNVEAIEGHVAAGSDLDQLDAFGSSPLLVATTFGRTEAVRVLVEGGADLTIPNREGATPLHVAAFLGRPSIAEVLLDGGAPLRRRSDDGASAFDVAAVPVDDDGVVIDQLQASLGMLGLKLNRDSIQAGRTALEALLAARTTPLFPAAFAPGTGGDWRVSTPAAAGLDAALLGELYAEAAALESIRGLLVVTKGHLVAEGYFNGWRMDEPTLVQSVTKSVTSALVGIALARGCLDSLDTRMLDFFPERLPAVRDMRKGEVTLRHLLQMRAGYGYEPGDSALWQGLTSGKYLPQIADFPLERDPGSGFEYSNLSSHLLGVIVSRACETDLLEFARTHVFDPMGVAPGRWEVDGDGYRYGYAGLHLTARDMARLGDLYLDDGVWEGRRILPEEWVAQSLTSYSSAAGSDILAGATIGRYFREVEYGYQWWSARVGGRRIDFAWGYGGQLIVLLPEVDTVVVVTSDPFVSSERVYLARKAEPAAFNIVGRFIRALPGSRGGD